MRWRTLARDLTLSVLPVVLQMLLSELEGRMKRREDTAEERRTVQPSQSLTAQPGGPRVT